ncbi:MAG: hypothetical protein GX781_00235 [Clostridiales bacterium]|nr:hypothetical protein [Clostridiales bacterium]
MNAFADWLFSTLFGWMGTAANSAWNAIVNASGGISSFFSKYWLVFVIIIVAGGTFLDYAVWFARWRPHLVWRSWLNRSRKQKKSRQYAHDLEQVDMDEDTRDALADWVSSPQEPFYFQNENNTFHFDNDSVFPHQYMQAHAIPYSDDQNYIESEIPKDINYYETPAPQNNAVYWPQPNAETYPNDQYQNNLSRSQTNWVPTDLQSFEGYAPQAMHDPTLHSDFAVLDQPQQNYGAYLAEHEENDVYETSYDDPGPAIGRQRRTHRSKKSSGTRRFLHSIKERMEKSEDQESMLDGLPSPVRQEDAFHQPVYPKSYHYQDISRHEDNEEQDRH